MKVFPLVYFLFIAVVTAEVPSLINYQGRLTNAEGDPLTGTKNFELKIFDSQTEGNLLYTEDVGAIQLGEGGVYSFQFGGKGTSNTQITETVGTGNGENLYQKILSNTPVVEGSVSVSDGTYTWSQESGSSNEDDFSSSYSKNLSRITVNYFAGAPDDNREIKVTYRYEAEGIIGALSSGSGHWLQLSVDGNIQSARERVLAVPFALYAGNVSAKKSTIRFAHDRQIPLADTRRTNRFSLPDIAIKIDAVTFTYLQKPSPSSPNPLFKIIDLLNENSLFEFEIDLSDKVFPKYTSVLIPVNVKLDPNGLYAIEVDSTSDNGNEAWGDFFNIEKGWGEIKYEY